MDQRKCSRCKTGTLNFRNPQEPTCFACGNVEYLQTPSKNGVLPTPAKFSIWDKNAILNALSEVYLRTKGNIYRSKYESTQRANKEIADRLADLMKRVEGDL